MVTLFLCIFTLGVGAGSLLCPILQRHFELRNWLLLQLVGVCICLGLLWIQTPFHVPYQGLQNWILQPLSFAFVSTLFGLSFTLGMYVVPLYTALQVFPEDHEKSKAIANNNIFNSLYDACYGFVFFICQSY
ncbi:MAG: hypothetical protein R3A45_07625 [Bdellovibrionota bacterium]